MSGVQPSQKRDKFRKLFRSSQPPPSGSVNSTSAGASSSISLHVNAALPPGPGAKFFAETLSQLETKERGIIEKYAAHGAGDINMAVTQAYRAALDNKQACEDRMWQWSFRGRTVMLRDEADKMLRWLNRFKSVGDIVANIDPVHVGLPWAGIRVLLEVGGAESRQMAALLTGMNLAMGTASRLQVYFDQYTRLPSTLATDNFEKALIRMYVHVLRFVATAIETYEHGLATRAVQALWQTSSLEQFESECDKLGHRTEIEASNCARAMDERNWEDARRWREDLRSTLKSIDHIQGINESLSRVHVKLDLTKLITAPGATYNSYREEEFAHCLPGTRVVLLDQIAQWANDENGKCIFWLCGKAGTGKSTISRTVADRLDRQQRLGASFFFKRGEGDRGNASRFFPTIAAQLADVIPGLSSYIAEALERDSFLSSKGLQDQFEKLLSQPLTKLTDAQAPPSRTFLVIDALDECESEGNIRMLLSQLARLEAVTSLRLRIFVTSRPVLPIKLGFTDIRTSLHQDIVLEEVQVTTIEQDIRTYFQHRLKEIRSEDSAKQLYDPLAVDWPGENSISALVELAVPLFIFASTVCRYIAESDPRERLDSILQQQQEGRNLPLSGLAKTYLPILDQLTTADTLPKHDQIIADFKEVVGSIVLLANPLSASSLSNLLDIRLRVIGKSISKLHSVLDIPVDHDAPIRLFHLSFHDFLVDAETKDHNKFWISEVDTHRMLARKCLMLLGKPGILQKDLCDVREPGQQRYKVSQQVVTNSIAADTAYSCNYWVWHLAEGGKSITDNGDEHVFLKTHFLHWMEALSWLGRLSEMINHISKLRSLVVVEQGSKLLLFLDDSKRFVLRNRHVVDYAPLQLYSSALIFTPSHSTIRQIFEEQHGIPWLTLLPKVPLAWSAEIQMFEGHYLPVSAVAFSPDGHVLASASFDMTVRLWNAMSGEMMQILEGHKGKVNDVAFSPDGAVLASASNDMTAQLWDATSGEKMSMLEGHEGYVNAVAFSPDGAVLASASDDGTVRLWDAKTGEGLRTLERHDKSVYDKQVYDVAFSPDGVVLASSSADTTVRLWNATTGDVVSELEGHNKPINAVTFAPHGQMLASASSDGTVRLWSVETGKELQKLVEDADRIDTVAFSPNGQVLASTVDSKVVSLYDATTGKAIQKFEGHDLAVFAVVFSPDSQVLASASSDGTVRLWNATAGEATPKLKGHNTWVTALNFSSDGQLLASASSDKTVRLWNAKTGKAMQTLEGHEAQVYAVTFSHDDSALASASHDMTVRLWDVKKGVAIQKLEGHDDQVTALAFAPDGDVLASASSDKTVRIWNVKTGEAIQRLAGHDEPVTDVAFSPDGQMLASASMDRTVRLWNATTGDLVSVLEGHDDLIRAVAFSPNGQMLVSVAWHSVWLWSAMIGKPMQKMKSSRLVTAVSFATDGMSLLTDIGRFEVTQYFSGTATQMIRHSSGLLLSDEWLQYQGRDLLWLPHEYRGSCSRFYGDTIVIGQYSGAVSFIRHSLV